MADIHSKCILNNPSIHEILTNPEIVPNYAMLNFEHPLQGHIVAAYLASVGIY